MSANSYRFWQSDRVMDWLVRRSVAVLSGAFVAGALMEAGLTEGKTIALVALMFAFITGVIAFAFVTHRLLWLTLASLALGFGLMRWRLPPTPPDLKAPFDGIVAAIPMPTPYGYRLLLWVDKPVNGFAQIAVRDDPLSASPRWQIGDRVLVRRFWGRPSSWRRHRFQRIFWVGRTNADDLQRIGYEASAFPLTRWRERWRRWVFQRWQQSLPPRERALDLPSLASLVFGVRTAAISESDSEAFARSGLAHLFVPSGSQVTLLMGLVWFAHRYLHLPPLPLLLSLLAFYLPLTQGEPSIYRAVLMGLYAFAGWVWFREVDWHTALWLSSALLVLVKPEMLHDAGFQLSYAATFGLVYASPLLLRWLGWLPEWLRFPMAATLSAQLFLTPILMHYFGRVSLVGPIANLFAVLPASFALTLGFVSALLSSLMPLAAMPISLLAGKLASFVVGIAHAFAAPPWACLFVAPPSAIETLMMLAVLTASVAWLKGNQTSEREKIAMPLTNP